MRKILKNNRAFPWVTEDGIHVKGAFYDRAGNLYERESLLAYFKNMNSEEVLCSRLREANGSFALFIEKDDGIFVAVDRLRAIPMFLVNCDEKSVGDDAEALRDAFDVTDIDPLGVEEFLQAGYTVGNRTLYKEIKQLMAGQYAVLRDGVWQIKYYYEHTHSCDAIYTKDEAFQELDKISKRMFQGMIDSVHGRQIVVPLSGGYDSRYIVAWLKKLGYQNVLCFTYGRPESFEVIISKQVAEHLGFAWTFVKYDDETWENILSPAWDGFMSYSGQLSQCPHLQDIFAIKQLLSDGVIQKDAVVVPGYCGDVLGGSFLNKHIPDDEITADGLAEYIYKNHFYFMKKQSMKKEILNDIKDSMYDVLIKSIDSFNQVSEEWFTKNRWSKFIVNALRGYDFFGLEWRMPLWDNELMEFWYRIPNEHRGSPTWYDEYLLDGIFKQQGIDICKEKLPNRYPYLAALRTGKKILQRILSEETVLDIRNRFFGKSIDINRFSSIYNILAPRLEEKEHIRAKDDPNASVSLWYIRRFAQISARGK